MSLDEFLEYTSQRKRQMQEHLLNKEKFADECASAVGTVFKTFFAHKKNFDTECCVALDSICASVFDLIPAFTNHYKKTDKLTFGIIPESEWVKHIDTTDSLAELKNKVRWDSFEKADEYVVKLQKLRKEQLICDKAYAEMHLCFKRMVYQYFPEITELPSMGFRELDYLLFTYAKECMVLLKNAVGFS